MTDYDETELLIHNNPFSLVTLAVKYAIESKNDEELRYNFKSRLMRLMLTRGYNHKEIENLFRFIELTLELSNETLNKKLYAELKEMVKEEKFMVLTKFEEMAMERGEAKGKAEGKIEGEIEKSRKIAKNLLNMNMPIEQIAQVTELSVDEIKNIGGIN